MAKRLSVQREVWLDDVKKGCTYLAVEEGEILGIFAFQTTPDVSYYEIDGKWLTDGEYASMHRVCVADESKGKGVCGQNVFDTVLRWRRSQALKQFELIHIRGICLCRERLRKQALSAAGKSSLRKARRPET